MWDGKTLAALAPIGSLLKDDDSSIRRCVAATANKQQTKQFTDECQSINRSIYDPDQRLNTIVLVGKKDLHPYLREELLMDSNEDLNDLRDRTADLVRKDSDAPLDIDLNRYDGDPDAWYSRERARVALNNAQALVETIPVEEPAAEVDLEEIPNDYERIPSHETGDGEERIRWEERTTLSSGGYESPFPRSLVTVEDIIDGEPRNLPEELTGPIDPFYLAFFANNRTAPFGFTDGTNQTINPEQLRREAIPRGVDPHECMAALGAQADVIVCNYNHILDEQTRLLTDHKMGILDENTALIVDEAHNLEARARDLFTTGLGRETLAIAQGDLAGAADYVEHGTIRDSDESTAIEPRVRRHAQTVLNNYETIDLPYFTAFERILERFKTTILKDMVTRRFDEWDTSWRRSIDLGEIPKSFPEETTWTVDSDSQTDALTDALETNYNSIADDVWSGVSPPGFEAFISQLPKIAEACTDIWQTVAPGRDLSVHSVATFLQHWISDDATAYHRTLSVERSKYDQVTEWHRVYNIAVELTNCIPADDIADTFDELGGGVLMSATLEPLPVFEDVTGLSQLDENGRRIVTESYATAFPSKNRALLTTDIPAYTQNNRGAPTKDLADMSPTRRKYARELTAIATTHGNILIGMPSYDEAEWLATYLQGSPDVGKEVLADEPNTPEETNALFEEFTAGPPKVLVTSLRGTLTEGVDYPGEKLHAAAVVGVPIASMGDEQLQKVETAYGERFGKNKDFDYTFAIPAVRKARQCLGRVIRSSEDIGVQLLLDNRYRTREWNSVNEHLSPTERDELRCEKNLPKSINLFWELHQSL